MQEETPAPVQGSEKIEKKSSKGWMVAAIILLIGVIALGVTEFLAYQEISKKDDEIANLKQQITPTVDQKENEETEVIAGPKGFDTKIEEVIKLLDIGDASTTKSGYAASIYDFKTLKTTKDGKYLYSEIVSRSGPATSITLVYRELPDGAWKTSGISRNSVSLCKDYSKEVLEILIDYGKGQEEACQENADSEELTKIQDYYDKTYKK